MYSNNNSKSQYKVPFNIELIEQDENYHKYENINKTIFALNNMPEIVHHLLFENNTKIAFNYYFVRLDLEKSLIQSNLELLNHDIENQDIEYIFIRLNLINEHSYFNHVNGIYINKNKKYILIFEPKLELSFDAESLETFLVNEISINTYKFIYAKDLGYDIYHRIQNYDLFCQTYVIFAFLLIVVNDDTVNYDEYGNMFQSIINSKNVGYLLYYVDTLLQKNNYEICDQPELWALPTNKLEGIKNIIKYLLVNKKEEAMCNLHIYEKDDLIIVNNQDSTNSFGNEEVDDVIDDGLRCNLKKSIDSTDNISPPVIIDVDVDLSDE
ncbi:MAG: hypothetical protein MUO21_06820 [Nitrososphaeraceae archaeon]|nr:hypothetical protein [Nitrososphaeraceae archaeon]